MPTKSTRKSLHIKRIWAIFLDMILLYIYVMKEFIPLWH